MNIRTLLLAASAGASALAFGSIATPALAGPTVVATIVGAYNKDAYDSPELDITNTSGGTLHNVQMVLKGYQGQNNGVSQVVALADIGAGTTDIVWGSIPGAPGGTTAGNLTAYDYDDEWGNTPGGYTNPDCVVTAYLCSVVGNFSVTLTATIMGGAFDTQAVVSQFSPNNNYTGGFVGWEGLDPNGLSETVYDNHSGTFGGTMAIVTLGTPTDFNPNGGVPEPATWAMMLLGFGAMGGLIRQRRAMRRCAA